MIQAAAAREAARKARDLTRARARSTSPRCPASSPTARSATRPSPKSSSSRAIPPAARPSGGASRQNQAILPLRGKILNVERVRFDRMLSSEMIGTLITALGTGIGKDEFNADKLRYHKIIIMTDADVDGAHIRTLLLTFFFRQMPELIERGHLYIAQPPLYKVTRGKTSQYIKDERALEDFLIGTGLDEASLMLGSGEVRAGADLRARRSSDARRVRSLINGLHSRYNRARGRAGGDRRRAQPDDRSPSPARRDDGRDRSPRASTRSPRRPSAAGTAVIRLRATGGYVFERTVRGVKEYAHLDMALLNSADARALDRYAPRLGEVYGKLAACSSARTTPRR